MMNSAFPYLPSLLYLNQLPLKDRHELKDLLSQGIQPSEIYERILKENLWDRAERLQAIVSIFNAEKEIETCSRLGVRLLTLLDPEYPSLLKQIYNPPLVLYLKGQLISEDRYAVAVVGTRHPSFYGIEQTQRFVRGLSEKGLTIVSGLAKGVDHVAHQAALEIPYGRTLGILGCGVDVIYPSGSEKLYQKMSERGAVISEYPLGTQPLARHFPERNRIISGLSRGVLVIEAHYRSGALITAHEAVEEGRDVFAVPGPVNQITSRGTHRLLKEGAYLAENPEDILEILVPDFSSELAVETEASPEIQKPQGESLTKKISPAFEPADCKDAISPEEMKLTEILKVRPLTSEEWIEISGLNPAQAITQLTLLEMRHKIVKKSDGSFTLIN